MVCFLYLIKKEVINLLVSNTSERLNYLMETMHIKQIDILNKCEPFCKRYNVKMGRNDISQYVSGKVKPKQDKISILASALGVDEAWLIGYDVPMKKTDNTHNTYSEIGNNLKNIRESRNISTEEMANELGISVEDVFNYENGLKEIPIEYLKMFATYFNVSVDELISFDVDNHRTVFITKRYDIIFCNFIIF